ncbi:short chain dehydrogenase reductase [Mycena polygramma]|nr:short chain dehydrogenase reductase [Mycena polygramma]
MVRTFGFSTSAEEVAAIFTNEARGKNVLITGTSLDGIGFETARVLAKHAKLDIMADQKSRRLKRAEDAIKKDKPTAEIRPVILDLSSLSAVRKAAAQVNTERLHILIHNAAAPIASSFKLTVDNLEKQMATDHIGPFLLTKLFTPKILAARAVHFIPRVIVVASMGHALGTGVNFNTLGRPDPKLYEAMETYYQSKAANVLTAIELSKRAKGQINAYSLDPGRQFKTIAQGAATTLVTALDPALPEAPGTYLSDCVVANELVAPHSDDPGIAEKLWTMTEQNVGEPFVF